MSSGAGQAFSLADNSKSDADVPSKQALLWSWEQNVMVASIILQKIFGVFSGFVSRAVDQNVLYIFAAFDSCVDTG